MVTISVCLRDMSRDFIYMSCDFILTLQNHLEKPQFHIVTMVSATLIKYPDHVTSFYVNKRKGVYSTDPDPGHNPEQNKKKGPHTVTFSATANKFITFGWAYTLLQWRPDVGPTIMAHWRCIKTAWRWTGRVGSWGRRNEAQRTPVV